VLLRHQHLDRHPSLLSDPSSAISLVAARPRHLFGDAADISRTAHECQIAPGGMRT